MMKCPEVVEIYEKRVAESTGKVAVILYGALTEACILQTVTSLKKRVDSPLVYVIDEACVSMVDFERETAAKRILLQGAEFKSL